MANLTNIERLSFSLSPRNATTQFSADVVNVNNISPGTTFSGSVLDYDYDFEVERITKQGDRAAISGASFSTDLLNTLINYRLRYTWEGGALTRPTFQNHVTAIRNELRALGCNTDIHFIGADFYPKTDMNVMLWRGFELYEYYSGSFSEHLSRLIGWSDSVPNMTYNLFILDGEIYIVERGYENSTPVEITNFALMPTLTYSIRRTEWAKSQYQSYVPKEITSSDVVNSNEPFSGQLSWGSTTLYYTGGYLMREERGDDGQGGATNITTYTYTAYGDSKYLTKKQCTDTETNKMTVSEYEYENTGTQYYLYEEVVKEYSGTDISTAILDKETTTRHFPIGNGWYGTTTYDTTSGNEQEIGSNLSQGAPGQKASQYTIDKSNDALKPASAVRQMKVQLRGVAKARQSYPVADRPTLQKIANALDSYEGKTEITLQGELVGGNHIFDYRDKIRYDNNDYYLVSNNVSQNYNTIRQNITAVRWVL